MIYNDYSEQHAARASKWVLPRIGVAMVQDVPAWMRDDRALEGMAVKHHALDMGTLANGCD